MNILEQVCASLQSINLETQNDAYRAMERVAGNLRGELSVDEAIEVVNSRLFIDQALVIFGANRSLEDQQNLDAFEFADRK